MSKLLDKFIHNTSSFRHMAICAIIIGLGDILCALTDLGWLIGDMVVQIHPHHYYVLVGLIVANICIFGSFIWLVKSIYVYTANHDKKIQIKRNTSNKISKQSKVILHLNQRIDEVEARLDNRSI